jgi:hypothetical protein
MRMAGRMGGERQTTQNLTDPRRRRRQGPAARQGCRSRPPGAIVLVRSARREPDSHGKTTRPALPADIFDVQTNVPLIHQVVAASSRPPARARTPPRPGAEVSGGGKKPYRQKGTGRARQGSTRAPQFAGGGVVHGPQPRDYSQRTPKKMKAAALRGALSDRARNGRIHVVDVWSPVTPLDFDRGGGAGRSDRPHQVARRARAWRPGRSQVACATSTRFTSWLSTSSTPTTCCAPTTWSSRPVRSRR